MRRDRLKRWAEKFLGQFNLGPTWVKDMSERLVRELPGVLVEDDYLLDMDEMLGMHATYLEAQYQVADTALKEDLRKDGSQKVEHILEHGRVEDKREQVADLRIAIEERQELRCPECGTSPPATLCKMDCKTKKWKGKS